MSVVAFLSAKGSPGVTTTALLTAALWPRPVLLVDADTEGGDVALRLRREDGGPVDRSRGLLSLLALARRELSPSVLPDHAQTLRGGVEAVAGLSGPEQAGAAGQLWDNLGQSFSSTVDRDIVLDCGRVTSGSVHLPLLQQADLVVGVLRPTVSQVVHTRERLAVLTPLLVGPGGHRPRQGVVLVADRRSDRDAAGAIALLERDLPGVELLGVLADDERGAAVLEGVEIARPERTLLVRAGHELVATLSELLGHGVALTSSPPATAEAAEAAPALAPWRSLRRGRRPVDAGKPSP